MDEFHPSGVGRRGARVSLWKSEPNTVEAAHCKHQSCSVDPKAALEVPFISDGSSDLCESKHTTQDPESGTPPPHPLPALSTCMEVQQRPGEWLESFMGSDGSQMDQSSHLG